VIPENRTDPTEAFLSSFSPAAPSPGTEKEIALRGAAFLARRRKTRRLLAGSAAAAALCLGALFLLRDRGGTDDAVPRLSPNDTARLRVSEEEAALSVLGEIKRQLLEIKEMREVIPRKKERERRAISKKLTTCLKRLSELELKVKLRPGSSYRESSGAGKRNV